MQCGCVSAAGEARFLGVVEQFVSRQGAYQGGMCRPPGATDLELKGHDWRQVLEDSRFAAESIAAIGYWGPLGIDVVGYQTGELSLRWRSLQDINARWTMGRLLWEATQRVENDSLIWLHARRPAGLADRELRNRLQGLLPAGVRSALTTPETIDSEPTRFVGLLLCGDDPEALVAARRAVACSGALV